MKKIIKYFLVSVLLYFIICNIAIRLYSQSKPEPNADTMIILGAQVVGNPARPSYTLQERLDTAAVYLHNNLNTKVIVCGGKGKNEAATEASVMKAYLINQGIEATRIYEEDQSTRTAHQFIYAKNVLPLGKTIVVTSDFHLLRSVMLAKRSGLDDVSGLSAVVHSDNRDKKRALWREPLALINSFLFDHPKDE